MGTVVLVLAGEARWAAVPCINHLDQKKQEAPCFSPEWDTADREIGATVASAQWGCQSEIWGVNSGPVGSHMSGMRKQQFEE